MIIVENPGEWSRVKGDMAHKDVIIIGAGLGGLTTAAYLARAGYNVQIFEQHTLPGGYISSFTRICRSYSPLRYNRIKDFQAPSE